jgi:hypothetical protein
MLSWRRDAVIPSPTRLLPVGVTTSGLVMVGAWATNLATVSHKTSQRSRNSLGTVSEICFYQGFRLFDPAAEFPVAVDSKVVAEVFAEVSHE